MKSLFLHNNNAKKHLKYESSIKVAGIIQYIQKILRKYMYYFF
jgi:hypothetical protein